MVSGQDSSNLSDWLYLYLDSYVLSEAVILLDILNFSTVYPRSPIDGIIKLKLIFNRRQINHS